MLSSLGYGSGSVLAAPIYATGVDWLTLVTWRFAVGAVLAWGWIALSAERRLAARRLRGRPLLAALALGALFTGNAGTYYAGLESVPAALAGVLVYTYPVIVALLSLRFATRLPGRRPWVALALAVAGSALALGGIDVRSAPPVSGLVLVWASAVIYSVWIILSARLSGERQDRLGSDAPAAGSAGDAAVATAVMMSATFGVYAVGGVVLGRPMDPGTVPSAAWPGLVGVGFVASFLAIQAFYAGARRIGAAKAALVSTFEPPIIVTLSFVFLHQTLAPIQLLGAALILVAVVVAQTAPRPRGAPEPATPLESEAGV